MAKLIMIRHGESEWNSQNLFTGWIDIPLSRKGIDESLQSGEIIKKIPVDIIFTSSLIRAIMTALIAMSIHESKKVPVIVHEGEGKLEEWSKCYSAETSATTIPVIRAWELNERMYGELQGLNKQKTRERYGDEQVHIWRRSYDIAPPQGESLEMTSKRTLPYFINAVIPHLAADKNVFISAHGNSLRSIIMHLDNLTKEEVVNLELPTGKPIIYNYNNSKLTKDDNQS